MQILGGASLQIATGPHFQCGKSGLNPRTKPVIARDTTCSVSLLTGTIGGSNFAIPSKKIPPHGNGTGLPSK
jgi:hypothetical protein